MYMMPQRILLQLLSGFCFVLLCLTLSSPMLAMAAEKNATTSPPAAADKAPVNNATPDPSVPDTEAADTDELFCFF